MPATGNNVTNSNNSSEVNNMEVDAGALTSVTGDGGGSDLGSSVVISTGSVS